MKTLRQDGNDGPRDGSRGRSNDRGGRSFGGGNRGGFNRGGQRGGFNREPREMHKATCAKCQKECEVPFKPTEGRPVYCKDCYVKPDRY